MANQGQGQAANNPNQPAAPFFGPRGSPSPPPSPPGGLGPHHAPLNAGLYIPTWPPREPDDSLEAIVERFLSPYNSQYNDDRSKVIVDVSYAATRLGVEHFEIDESIDRLVLRQDTFLRPNALEAGIHEDVFKWLCGDPPEEVVWFPVEKMKSTKET
ncbi:hypothetical protein M011DRAFT_475450 [Sporormia fimetaria CBS 119925]|uniref:Uncharacterized protein n=1 Tax=Sporormia fimetaria CBS 119925 TaxID=1340428 RepID=A0A6A6VJI0_9PLEO|nr:hypothetical protein M011DRAFT_475450 [Sporormia fimetaria CBS 119925]